MLATRLPKNRSIPRNAHVTEGFAVGAMRPLWFLAGFAAALLVIAPPKFDLDPMSSIICAYLSFGEVVGPLLGKPVMGSFDPAAEPEKLAMLREVACRHACFTICIGNFLVLTLWCTSRNVLLRTVNPHEFFQCVSLMAK